MARLQDQLDSLLEDHLLDKLQPGECLKLLHRLQHRFPETNPECDSPIKLSAVSANLPDLDPSAAAPRDFRQMPGGNVRYRTHVMHLMKHLFHDPSPSTVNDGTELDIKGQAVRFSNFVDLLSDVFDTSQSHIYGPRPAGFPEFFSAQRDGNTTRTQLINPKFSS